MLTQTPVMWTPTRDDVDRCQLTLFRRFLATRYPEHDLGDYEKLHRFSIDESEHFWRELVVYLDIEYAGDLHPTWVGQQMPEVSRFPNVRLNFAQNLLRHARHHPEKIAIRYLSEDRPAQSIRFGELAQDVARCAARFRSLGLQPGQIVAGFIPNCPEAVIAMLAASSMGALWSSCSPDFGAQGVLDRFGQIKPTILIAARAYQYHGKSFDCSTRIHSIAEAIDSIAHVVVIGPEEEPAPGGKVASSRTQFWLWHEFLAEQSCESVFDLFAFDHPLYVLYSSGTTGQPKCIVHGAGGTLVQHAKELALHCDLQAEDNILYFTTCGWMMWNWLVSSLFTGATITLFDGSPAYPNLQKLWRVVDEEGVTHFGTSPKFLSSCAEEFSPKDLGAFQALRMILSTGAPLAPEQFDWVYEEIKRDVQLGSISGGTDIVSCFFLSNPVAPVYRGEIQSVGLGMDVAAFDEDSQAVVLKKGELVCRQPFISMPLGFWNDANHTRYRRAYFPNDDGIWYHGDYIALTGSQGDVGGVVVYGRSDATLNPGGVRIGTAEIYRIVETHEDVADSIVVGQLIDGDVRVVLFIKLKNGAAWGDDLSKTLKLMIRTQATPRHVPSIITPIADIPYTLSGKKVELAVRQILMGEDPKNRSALKNPEALDAFYSFVETHLDTPSKTD
jgi:acetoacetyl-CoA synthetase